MSQDVKIQNYVSSLHDFLQRDQTAQVIQDLTTRIYRIQIHMKVFYHGFIHSRSCNSNRERVSYSLIPKTFPEQLAFFRRNCLEELPMPSRERCQANLPFSSLSKYLLEILSLAKSNFPLCRVLRDALTSRGEASENFDQVLDGIEARIREQEVSIPASPVSIGEFTLKTAELLTMILLQDPDLLPEGEREEFKVLQKRVLEEMIKGIKEEQQGLVTSKIIELISKALFEILNMAEPPPYPMLIQELFATIIYLPQGSNERIEWRFGSAQQYI